VIAAAWAAGESAILWETMRVSPWAIVAHPFKAKSSFLAGPHISGPPNPRLPRNSFAGSWRIFTSPGGGRPCGCKRFPPACTPWRPGPADHLGAPWFVGLLPSWGRGRRRSRPGSTFPGPTHKASARAEPLALNRVLSFPVGGGPLCIPRKDVPIGKLLDQYEAGMHREPESDTHVDAPAGVPRVSVSTAQTHPKERSARSELAWFRGRSLLKVEVELVLRRIR
jgi:hypothetical protein